VTAAALIYLPTFYALYRYLVILDSDELHGFMSLLDLTLDLGPLNLYVVRQELHHMFLTSA
jgi:hypothetical protein